MCKSSIQNFGVREASCRGDNAETKLQNIFVMAQKKSKVFGERFGGGPPFNFFTGGPATIAKIAKVAIIALLETGFALRADTCRAAVSSAATAHRPGGIGVALRA